MLSDILSIQDRVKYVLEKDPPCRDNDKRLWLQCMVKFYKLRHVLAGSRNNRQDNVQTFIDWFMHSNVPSMESVRRCRQKLQEKFPELRGETYQHRHKEEKGVRQWARP